MRDPGADRRSFEEFVGRFEPRLRVALVAVFGPEVGRDAVAEALAYGWEHWDRIAGMENPGGYLYRVGYDRARRMAAGSCATPGVGSSLRTTCRSLRASTCERPLGLSRCRARDTF